MSATGRGRADGSEYEREPDDYYRTPGWATRAVLPWVPAREGRKSFVSVDAGAGDGAIADELPYGRSTTCYETNVSKAEGLRERGYFVPRAGLTKYGTSLSYLLAPAAEEADVVVMNPPYSEAMAFVQKALAMVERRRGCVVALLRLPWLASQERAAFHGEHPAMVLVLPRRPSFTKDGKTDATDYAWFLWGENRGAARPIAPSTWAVLDVEARAKRLLK